MVGDFGSSFLCLFGSDTVETGDQMKRTVTLSKLVDLSGLNIVGNMLDDSRTQLLDSLLQIKYLISIRTITLKQLS